MAVTTCIHHPTKMATARCKRCAKPICDDCKMVSEVGVVCSEECLDAIKQFQARVGDDLPGRKRRWFLPFGPVRGIVALLVVVAIVYGILCALEGRLLSAPEAFEEILSWIGL